MREKKSLYPRIYHWDNLLSAFRKASKGKRGREPAARFELRLEDNLINLQDELQNRTYSPGEYESFYIHDPKRRLISAAPFRDRVVHHALCNIIEPIFEKSFIHDSYANRIGKGGHRALARARLFARKNRYVLSCDVRQFFPSVDHALLRGVLSRRLTDYQVMWLIDEILKSGRGVLKEVYDMVYFPGDDLFAVNRPRGLPIGNLTSQFWANCFLNGFDHFVKRELQCKNYVRYVDDMLLFGNDRKTLWAWKKAIIERMAALRMTIHRNRAQVVPTSEGMPFLGFGIYRHKMRLKRRKGIAFTRKFRALISDYKAGRVPLEKVTASARGWANHAGHGDTLGLRKAVLCSITLPSQQRINRDNNSNFHQNIRFSNLASRSHQQFSPEPAIFNHQATP